MAFSGFSIDVSVSGGSTDLKGHIFKTINGGANWTDVGCHTADCAAPLGTDLPNTPVNDILLDPDDSARGTIYAATDIGIFVSANGGATWATMGAALPNVPVLSLALHEPSRTLRAATHGRSAWDYSLPGLSATTPFVLSGINPTSTQSGGAAFTLTLNGSGFTGNSTVRWNGSSMGISTVVVNTGAQTITAQIAASLIAQPGTANVSVFDSSLTPNNTNALSLIILGSVPTLSAVVPSSVNAGANDTAITITGTGFNQNAQVTFKNSATGVTGTVVNAGGTQITATLSHTLLVTGGQFFIGVTNLPPGGGAASPQLLFTVNASTGSRERQFCERNRCYDGDIYQLRRQFRRNERADGPDSAMRGELESESDGKIRVVEIHGRDRRARQPSARLEVPTTQCFRRIPARREVLRMSRATMMYRRQ